MEPYPQPDPAPYPQPDPAPGPDPDPNDVAPIQQVRLRLQELTGREMGVVEAVLVVVFGVVACLYLFGASIRGTIKFVEREGKATGESASSFSYAGWLTLNAAMGGVPGVLFNAVMKSPFSKS